MSRGSKFCSPQVVRTLLPLITNTVFSVTNDVQKQSAFSWLGTLGIQGARCPVYDGEDLSLFTASVATNTVHNGWQRRVGLWPQMCFHYPHHHHHPITSQWEIWRSALYCLGWQATASECLGTSITQLCYLRPFEPGVPGMEPGTFCTANNLCVFSPWS